MSGVPQPAVGRPELPQPHPCGVQHRPGWDVNSLQSVGNAVVKPSAHGQALQKLSGAERARYQRDVAAHRPYRLELLHWNHDPEGPEADTYTQLRCLSGDYRGSIDGGPGGGTAWRPLELEGVFLRHLEGPAMVWLPEAGPNLLLYPSSGGPCFLLEAVELERRPAVADRAVKPPGAEGEDLVLHIEVSAPARAAHPRVLVRDAAPHLTDSWLQAADDLRDRWPWNWRPLRETSPFAFSQAKLVYGPGYPIADASRGFYGESRWQWRWVEDGEGLLTVRNHFWPPETYVYISATEVVFKASDGEVISDFEPLLG